jgi:hypothetical protein
MSQHIAPDETDAIAQLKAENAEMKLRLTQLELALNVVNWRPTSDVQNAYLQKLRAFETDNNLTHILEEVA